MAAKETPELTDNDLGRIIHLIQSEWHEKRDGGYWNNQPRVRTARRFSDGQIAALLNITPARLKKLSQEYKVSIDRWGEGRLQARIVKFVLKEKRWPHRGDFGSAHDMPSSSTYTSASGQRCLHSWFETPENCRSVHPSVILGVTNVTWRAELIERFGGYEEIVKKGGGTIRQQDDYGILWELPPEPDVTEEVALWLEVTNATVVDGEQEHFFLRMPPTMKTAKEAVEWSFNIPSGQLHEFAAQT